MKTQGNRNRLVPVNKRGAVLTNDPVCSRFDAASIPQKGTCSLAGPDVTERA